MRPFPLRTIAVPSSTVLSFLRVQLRNAFESPSAQCAALRGQRRAYAGTTRAQGCLYEKARGGSTRAEGIIGQGRCGSFVPPKGLVSESRMLCPSQSMCRPSSATNAASVPLVSHRWRRGLSTSPSKAWQLFGGKKRGQPPGLLPPSAPIRDAMGDSAHGFDALGRMARPANEMKMRCTELDQDGNVTMVSGEFKKSELIAKVRRNA